MNYFELYTQSLRALGGACLLALAAPVVAETVPADYSQPQSWLCRGDQQSLGACDADMATTIVAADGSLSRESWSAAEDAPIDCFYVYPTVSLDKTPNSDMIAGEEEFSVIRQQFARMGSVCRTFAPLYRQITLTALRSGMSGGGEFKDLKVDRALGYNDVVAAWNHYLENHNNGRGVVLVGHSQGSGVLTQLLQKEIEGKPVQDKIISAMLIGTNVQVPEGDTVGATFKHMPLCESADQTQCIITYATFRSTIKPPANSLFGRNGKGQVSACTNPAQLAKGSNQLHAYLNTQQGVSASSVSPNAWTEEHPTLETPFASVPGLLSAECVQTDSHSYLEMTVHADTSDPRADDISGDVVANGEVNAGWGLHLIDMNIAMGDLISIIEQQRDTYRD